MSISKCFYPNNLFLFWAGGLIYHFHNKSVELKISSFQFETGPGGEDEECLDDGSGEEPEGESESERFEQILESVVKVKVKRKVKVKLKFGQQLISPYFPAPRPLHLKADLHQEGIFFFKQYSNTNIDSKSLSVCCKYRHANKTDFSGSWKTHC